MIILDTSVMSALMRIEPETPVVQWLDAQPATSVWITAITVMEIRFGLQTLPKGRRRRALLASFELMLKNVIEGRIASFDAKPPPTPPAYWLNANGAVAAPKSATP
jgi:predicted nucleic acid-binding protein